MNGSENITRSENRDYPMESIYGSKIAMIDNEGPSIIILGDPICLVTYCCYLFLGRHFLGLSLLLLSSLKHLWL